MKVFKLCSVLFAFTLSIILFSVITINAQHVEKGSIMLGGSLNFESKTSDFFDDNITFIEFSPNIGYFIGDNFGMGLATIFARAKYDNSTVTLYGLGPYVRYYLYDGFFPQVQYLWEKIEDSYFDESETNTGFNFSLGYTLFLNSSIALEPSVFYKVTDDFNSYGLKIGVQAFLGRKEIPAAE